MSEHRPFVPDDSRIAEFTLRAVVMGVLLGMVFGASSLYLVLKVGLTVSASIPVALDGEGKAGEVTRASGPMPAPLPGESLNHSTRMRLSPMSLPHFSSSFFRWAENSPGELAITSRPI
jgi:hypothetical protein